MEAWIWSENRLTLAAIVCIYQAWHTDWKAELMLAAARLCWRASEKLIFDSNLCHFTKLPLPTCAITAITWLPLEWATLREVLQQQGAWRDHFIKEVPEEWQKNIGLEQVQTKFSLHVTTETIPK